MRNVRRNQLVILSREDGEEFPADGSGLVLRQGIPRPPSAPPARNDRCVTSSVTGPCAVPLLGMAAVLFFLAACATTKAPLPPRLPQWGSVPAAVLDALCANFRDEGISTSTTINVVKTAQRLLITPASMQALSESQFYHGLKDAAHAASAVNAAVEEIPIAIPPGCAWRPIEPQSGARYTDTMTLELSPPIVNPFARNEAGLFARLALAGEAPTWYWMPLVPRGEAWAAGRLTVLPYRQ
jgi:hypothetical protein